MIVSSNLRTLDSSAPLGADPGREERGVRTMSYPVSASS